MKCINWQNGAGCCNAVRCAMKKAFSFGGALFLRMNGRKMERGGGQCEAAKHEVGRGAGEPGVARPEAGKKTLAFAAIRAYFGANGLIYL